MSLGAVDAAAAYGRVAGLAKGLAAPAAQPAGETAPGSFGQLVSQLVDTTAGSLKAAEAATAKQAAGKGDLIDVVTAISAAETALETMVAVRDRVVGAYSEIMRMQV